MKGMYFFIFASCEPLMFTVTGNDGSQSYLTEYNLDFWLNIFFIFPWKAKFLSDLQIVVVNGVNSVIYNRFFKTDFPLM